MLCRELPQDREGQFGPPVRASDQPLLVLDGGPASYLPSLGGGPVHGAGDDPCALNAGRTAVSAASSAVPQGLVSP